MAKKVRPVELKDYYNEEGGYALIIASRNETIKSPRTKEKYIEKIHYVIRDYIHGYCLCKATETDDKDKMDFIVDDKMYSIKLNCTTYYPTIGKLLKSFGKMLNRTPTKKITTIQEYTEHMEYTSNKLGEIIEQFEQCGIPLNKTNTKK